MRTRTTDRAARSADASTANGTTANRTTANGTATEPAGIGSAADVPASADGPAVEPESTLKFRGSTVPAALELAERSLGGKVRLLAADRLRRGGIGGFFASDLGVEITVTLENETIEEALERLINASADEERDHWRGRSAPTEEIPVASATAESPVVETLVVAMPAAVAPVASTPAFAATHRRFEDLLPELDEYLDVHRPVAVATTSEVITRVVDVVDTPVAPPAPVVAPAAVVPVAQPDPVGAGDSPVRAPASAKASAAVMRRQVELAVAAADQLIDSIGHLAGVQSVSIRVKLTAADQSEVETEAEWHAAVTPPPVRRAAPRAKPVRKSPDASTDASADPSTAATPTSTTTPAASRRRSTRGATT